MLSYLALSLLVVAVVVWLVWRLSSNRRSLPCPAWLGWMVELDNPFTKENQARTIISRLDLAPGMKALDAGCGPGRLTIPLAAQVGPNGVVLAVDLQKGMLDRVQQKVKAQGFQNVTTLQAGLGERKLPKAHFDRAVMVTVLGEIPDQSAALQEVFTALKPGGLLSITEVIFDPHFQREEKILPLAEAAGFRKTAFFGRRLAYTLHLEKPA